MVLLQRDKSSDRSQCDATISLFALRFYCRHSSNPSLTEISEIEKLVVVSDLMCPWSQFKPAVLQFCERPLCAWIREPANTWSNLSYILIGLWLIHQAKKQDTPHTSLLGIYSIILGFMSFFYHASGTFIGEVLDFSSMFLLSSFCLSSSLTRFYDWDYKSLRMISVSTVAISACLLVLFQSIGVELFALQLFGTLIFEYLIYKQKKEKTQYKPLLWFMVSFTVAYIVWQLDHKHIVCYPDFHWINGHAIWHILTAVGIYFIFKYYSQFKDHHDPKN